MYNYAVSGGFALPRAQIPADEFAVVALAEIPVCALGRETGVGSDRFVYGDA